MEREIPGSSLHPAHCSPALSPTSEPSRKPVRCNLQGPISLCPPQSRTEQRKLRGGLRVNKSSKSTAPGLGVARRVQDLVHPDPV